MIGPVARLACACLTFAAVAGGCAGPSPTPPIPYLPQYLNVKFDSGSFKLPQYASFDRGACVITGRDAVALAAGPKALLLCDLAGPNNRCELLLQDDDYEVMYERIGQRPRASSGARRILEPVGVKAKTSDKFVTAKLNLYLQRSERMDLGPRLQRAGRELRLTGNLRMPLLDKEDPLAAMILELDTLLPEESVLLSEGLPEDLPAFKRIKIKIPKLPKLKVFK